MELKFEHSRKVTSGKDPVAVQIRDEEVYVFFRDPQQEEQDFKYVKAKTPRGVWKDLEFKGPEIASRAVYADEGPVYINSYNYAGEENWLVWFSRNIHRIAKFPGDAITSSAPYKLYYTTDTDRIFWNINDSWYMVASLRHNYLRDLLEDNHPQYLNKERHSEDEHSQVLNKVRKINILGM